MKKNICKALVASLATAIILGVTPTYAGYTQNKLSIQSEHIINFEETLKIANLDYETASQEMKAEILRARYEVIFAQGGPVWGFNPDGSVPTIIDVDGTEIEIASFEEVFPGWCFKDIMTFTMQEVEFYDYKDVKWSLSVHADDTEIQIPTLDKNFDTYNFKEIETLVKEEVDEMASISATIINWNGRAIPPIANAEGTNGLGLGPQRQFGASYLNEDIRATFVSGPSEMPTVNLGFWNVATNQPGKWRAGVSYGQSVHMSSFGQPRDAYEVRVSTRENENGLATFNVRRIIW